MINFSDVLKGKFLEEFAAISIGGMMIAIVLSLLLSLFVVFIYRITYAGVSFNRNFAACLVLIGMVTALVIQVITSNVVLSLGMVGALSIVRFRTAVKEPADTAFLFWAIATGIICGAGYITISILATALIGLLFVAACYFGKKHGSGSYMIVARYEEGCGIEESLQALPGFRMKNKLMAGKSTELVAEVRLNDSGMEALSQLRHQPGVQEISVMRSVSGSVL